MKIKKSFAVVILLLLLCGAKSFAQPGRLPPEDAREASKEGKRALAIYRMLFREHPPAAEGLVNDWARELNNEQRLRIDSLLTHFRNNTGITIVLLTLDSAHSKPEKLEQLVNRMATKWGLIHEEDNNTILLAICKSYGAVEIENGYGLGKLITREDAALIANDYILPSMSSGNTYDALMKGISAITGIVEKKKQP